MTASPLARPLPALPPVAGVLLATGRTGLRYRDRDDLLLVALPPGTSVAGLLTRNRCPGAPVDWCRAILPSGKARALVVNAGNANVFTGRAGVEACAAIAGAAGAALGYPAEEVLLASTGVIGERLDHAGIAAMLPRLAAEPRADRWAEAARAIMTTDTFPKAATATALIGGTEVRIAGIAKGSGMIAPDLATMLAFVFTDAALPAPLLRSLLVRGARDSFNAITVDGDTSTSDTLLAFATGATPHPPVTQARDAADFARALNVVLLSLALLVARDGEGATKLIEVSVTGAVSARSARRVALAIANSPLVKTAIAGEDANWGRIVMAVGRAGEPVDRDRLAVSVGGIVIAADGCAVPGYDESPVRAHMAGQEISIGVDLGLGRNQARAWSCDLTHGYIDINGSYRS